jgi:hypothetical protein
VRVSGRRSAGRAMECTLWLPDGSGVVATATRGETSQGEATWGEDGPGGAGSDDGPEAA